MRSSTYALALVLLAACSKQPAEQPTTTPEPTGEETTPPPADTDTGNPERPGLTAAACEAQGGKVVGDIGDGATARPDFKCPDSGEPPIGSITPDTGGPVAVEGSVCCK